MKKLYIILAFIAAITAIPCHAQTNVINGVVYTLNDLPIANLEVSAKKSGASVLTDSLGNFAIVCNDKDVLNFKGKVFKHRKIKVKSGINYVEVELNFIISEENKEYAIGYGYISDAQRLNAAVTMADRNIFCSYSNIFDVIEGRFTNVQVSEDCVVIRGITTVNGNSCALYVVDGQMTPSISNIEPCTVKSIDIIKDGTAAIYGMQGANGVIIIELQKAID